MKKSCQRAGRVAGLKGGFCRGLQNCKEFHQVLVYQRFAVLQYPLQWLCSGFAVSIKPLIFNALQTSSKCLSLNDFAVLGGWVKGRVLSKG
jgi:hypothetical protein